MQKKSKTILTAVVTALFVLSLGYFALLAPTTAWYYQREDKNYSFTFGEFNMTAPQFTLPIGNFVFRDATRFADGGEVLFDEMTKTITVTASNAAAGRMAGRVSVRIKRGNTELKVDDHSGLKWFVFEQPTGADTAKSKINAMLQASNSDWPIDYNDLTSTTFANGGVQPYTNYNVLNGQAETAYEAYNAKAIKVLKENNDRGVSVMPGESKTINIVFWAEYGDLKEEFGVASDAADRTIITKNFGEIPDSDPVQYSDLTIEVFAMPDTGGTQVSTLTIDGSGVSASSNVRLSLGDVNDGWRTYTGAYQVVGGSSADTDASGTIVVPAGASVQVEIPDLPMGTQFRVEILDASPAAHFDSDDTAVQANETGTVIDGTLSNIGTTVTLTTQTRLVFSNSAATAATVKVSTWSNGAWREISSGSPVTVPADGSAQLALSDEPLGTRCKLEITSADNVYFSGSGLAKQIITTISGVSNAFSIVPNPNS